MADFLTLDDIHCKGKTVLVRADLNVPVQGGAVSDATRIERLAPTVKELLGKGAKVVLMSHFGRPKGKPDPDFSLKVVLPALEQVLDEPVAFAEDCVGDVALRAIATNNLVLLENLRFHKGEEADDPDFAAQLAALGDLYVNDAFSAAHRAHASTHALARLLDAYAGRLMEEELRALTRALDNPKRPVCAIVGGAKVSTKLDLLFNLVTKVDKLILGGGMANTFLYATAHDVGKSLCEKDMADQARGILERAEESGCEILLQIDAVVADTLQEGVITETVDIDSVPGDKMILDIGPETIAVLKESLDHCKTVVWNGPLGVFEVPPFDAGTNALARYVAERTAAGKLLSVAGGGDTVAALAHAGVLDQFSYVSTAGGAFLEWLEGKALPGVEALVSPRQEESCQAV